MKEIIKIAQTLSSYYIELRENADIIFNALKVKNYDKKALYEDKNEKLFTTKNQLEKQLILEIKNCAKTMGIDDERLESILGNLIDTDMKLLAEYEFERMFQHMREFQTSLYRNIEFSKFLLEIKNAELEITMDFINREQINERGPIFLSQEF